MIEHAWTVVCSNSSLDEQAGSISMQAVDQINIGEPLRQIGNIFVVPLPIHVVSFWYRREQSGPEAGVATISIVDAKNVSLAHFDVAVRIDSGGRARTRHLLPDFPITGPGMHQFVITFKQGDAAREVARIPLAIRLASPAA